MLLSSLILDDKINQAQEIFSSRTGYVARESMASQRV